MENSFISNITIEAQTALKVGSNQNDFLQDSPIQKDWNNLPMILGTSLAGVLRKEFDEEIAKELFGEDKGSRLVFSNALLLDENKIVHENLLLEDNKSSFLQNFTVLPIREHTSITEQGVAKEHSKFDEEVVFKGAQFKFSISMEKEDENDLNLFNQVLEKFYLNSLRIGAGSTKGFGRIKIISIEFEEFNTNEKEYINHINSLNTKLKNSFTKEIFEDSKYDTYKLKLKPDDFFMFGSGFGDDDADMTPTYEKIVDYDKQDFYSQKVLIPASSLKGAISHRSTYHYNLSEKMFIGDVASENIKEIFGAKKDKEKEGSKGKILFSDIYLNQEDTNVFEHVSIDRFTGGAIDSALFQEKTIASKEEFICEIQLEKNIESTFVLAFEEALKDITTGMLSLGGSTTKGHGIFQGNVYKNGEII